MGANLPQEDDLSSIVEPDIGRRANNAANPDTYQPQLSDSESPNRPTPDSSQANVLSALNAGATPDDLHATITSTNLRVEVRDRGAGVSVEEVPALFEPFSRGASSAASHVPGIEGRPLLITPDRQCTRWHDRIGTT